MSLTKSALLDKKMAEFGPMPDRSSMNPHVALRLPGAIDSMIPMSSPSQLFPAWRLDKELRDKNRRIVAEGQEQIDGRDCTRVRVEPKKGPSPNPSCQRFWVDLERNAQMLKYEMVNDSKASFWIDDIKLVPIPRPGGADYWMPVSSRLETLVMGLQVAPEPCIEHIVNVIEGSVRLDLDMPDAAFGGLGDTSAIPGGAAVEAVAQAGTLHKVFETEDEPQPAEAEKSRPQRKSGSSSKEKPR